MGDLLIVTGPPGAGRSTIASRLVELRTPSALGDSFFQYLRQGRVEPWLTESRHQNVIVTGAAATGRFAARGYWTVFDGVIGPWYLQRSIAATASSTE